jgi:uncharacterized protein YggL (DUF469 family)
MYQDEELHDQLLKKFREYFEANQEWLSKGTKRSAIKLRRIMSEIRKICSERRVVVREWAEWKEAELRELETQRQIQKRQAEKTGGDT